MFSSRNGKPPAHKSVPGTPFLVDAFQYLGSCPTQFWVLTHFHADHYGGLSKKRFTEDHGKIYCSEITANMCRHKFKIDASKFVILTIGTFLSVDFPLGNVTISCFDANHCPGALLVLFDVSLVSGERKRIVHSGDMRYHTKMNEYKALQGADELYLDTTYCAPKYTFPPQDDMIELIVKEISECWKDNAVFLIGTYSVGKERILLQVSKSLSCKIFLEKQKMKDLRLLQLPCVFDDTFTSDKSETRIHVKPMGKISYKGAQILSEEYSEYDMVVCFKPTGWSLNKKRSMTKSYCGNVVLCGVPYSEHSSFSELVDFVKFVKPKKVIPTVNCESKKEVEKMLQYFKKDMDESANPSKILSYFKPLTNSQCKHISSNSENIPPLSVQNEHSPVLLKEEEITIIERKFAKVESTFDLDDIDIEEQKKLLESFSRKRSSDSSDTSSRIKKPWNPYSSLSLFPSL